MCISVPVFSPMAISRLQGLSLGLVGIHLVFDLILSGCLIVVIPAYSFLRELSAKGKPPQAKVARYLRSITMGAALLFFLWIDWITGGRSGATLGLATPPSRPGIIGLALAAVVLLLLGISTWMQRAGSPDDPVREAEARSAKELLPESKLELCVFILMSVVIGFAWEILFRGYLLWWLQPRVGLVLAVLIAATVYGLAHGYKSGRLFAGSLISAFAFTTAYAATRSLWWLILIHAGTGILAASANNKLSRDRLPVWTTANE